VIEEQTQRSRKFSNYPITRLPIYVGLLNTVGEALAN
jgi:hypothetical protein